MLDSFLETLNPMRAAKARAALTTQVRLNGGEFFLRHQIIEQRIAAGARVVTRRGERILMNADESWLDTRNITSTGLDYAAFIESAAS